MDFFKSQINNAMNRDNRVQMPIFHRRKLGWGVACGFCNQASQVLAVDSRVRTKCCMQTIYPKPSYNDVLFIAGLDTLGVSHENVVCNLFKEIQQPSQCTK